MTKLSKNRENYLLETYFGTKNKKNIPAHLDRFGFRDGETTDEELFFIGQYVTSIDRLILGGSNISKNGLEHLKKIKHVEHLDLRSLPLNDTNLDCILHFKTLKYIYMKFTDVTAHGISILLKSLLDLQTVVAEIPQNQSHFIEHWKKQYPGIELRIDIRILYTR